MGRTLVIAEIGSSWDCDCHKAERLISAAKECDADVAKFQWTSDPAAMAKRRGLGPEAEAMYRKYLAYPAQFLTDFKRICDTFGIEFACTVYLPQDIATIAPLVKRFKISAFENLWAEFGVAHMEYRKPIIASSNPENIVLPRSERHGCIGLSILHCVSKYPTPLQDVQLERIRRDDLDGFSDHTTSTLTGALAVAAGATIVEKHIRLFDTSTENPDYGHSLIANSLSTKGVNNSQFYHYVRNIREAEKAL